VLAPLLAAFCDVLKIRRKEKVWEVCCDFLVWFSASAGSDTLHPSRSMLGLRAPCRAWLRALLIHIAALSLLCFSWCGARIGRLLGSIRVPRSLRSHLRRSSLCHRFPPRADRSIIDRRPGDRGSRPVLSSTRMNPSQW